MGLKVVKDMIVQFLALYSTDFTSKVHISLA